MGITGSSNYVSLGGRRLQYQTAGEGPVTVFFEAGMGRSRSTWALVQPRVAEFARTVVYDRAGHGLSDPDPGGRDFDRLLSDHLAVVDAATEGTTIGVGHSYGGPIVRMAETVRPETFSALTLVDEVPETVEPDRMSAAMRGASLFYEAQVVLAKLGLLAPLLERFRFGDLTAEDARAAAAEAARMNAVRAAREEWRAFGSSFEKLHANGPIAPDVPMCSISSNRMSRERDRHRDFLGAAHARIAESSPEGRHLYSRNSSHNIQLTEPNLVVNEIHALVERVRARVTV